MPDAKLILNIRYDDGERKFRPEASEVLPSLTALNTLIRFSMFAALSERRPESIQDLGSISTNLLESKRGSFLQPLEFVLSNKDEFIRVIEAVGIGVLKDAVKSLFSYLLNGKFNPIRKFKQYDAKVLAAAEHFREDLETELTMAHRPITKGNRNAITVSTLNHDDVLVTLNYDSLRDLQHEEKLPDERTERCYITQFNARTSSGRLAASFGSPSIRFEGSSLSSDEKRCLAESLKDYTIRRNDKSIDDDKRISVKCNRVVRKDGTLKRYVIVQAIPSGPFR